MNVKMAYIAGPNATGKGRELMKKAETYLNAQGFGVISMHDAMVDGLGREEYLRAAVEHIIRADEVYFLEGWRNSDAAQVERSICTFLEKPIRHFT